MLRRVASTHLSRHALTPDSDDRIIVEPFIETGLVTICRPGSSDPMTKLGLENRMLRRLPVRMLKFVQDGVPDRSL
jgi:hypothetical protein